MSELQPAAPLSVNLLLNLDVPDLARARDFYTRAFGLRAGRRLGPNALELLGAALPIYLLEEAAGSMPAPSAAPRTYERHWTPLHLDLVVDDVPSALTRAEAAGARRESEIATHAWGRVVRIADPFGHGWCLLQLLNRGYDELVETAQ